MQFRYKLSEVLLSGALLSLGFWKLLLQKPRSFRAFYCRLRGHAGVYWNNPWGYEPDMHCKYCGDDLG